MHQRPSALFARHRGEWDAVRIRQIALDPASGEMVGTTIQEQTEQVMKNVTGLLEAAGTDLNHVVKTTCFLDDINDFVAFNEVYARYFDENLPARSA